MDQDLRQAPRLPRLSLTDTDRCPGVDPNSWPDGDWRALASCRNLGPELFHPEGKGPSAFDQTEVAKAICRGCAARQACLTFALATRQDDGVWGGTAPLERRKLIRASRRAAAH